MTAGAMALVLAGPTACGKSALAVEVAERVGAEIISADSCAVYRGMDIGSAKPSAESRMRVPHHLVDVCDPDSPYSAGAFCADAHRIAAEISARGRVPLLAGGAMMWLRRLRDGMSDLPRSDAVREEVKREMRGRGSRAMHRELAAVDADAARRIHPHDRARIVRALEVLRLTGGRRLAERGGSPPMRMRAVAFFPADRALLRARIRARLEEMFAAGFVEEVRGLIRKWGLDAESAALRAVGYRQVAAFLRGEIGTEAEARILAFHATCQLAKRQMTWLRSWTDASRVDPFSPAARGTVFKIAGEFAG